MVRFLYWLVTAHLLKELLEKDFYKKIDPNITKKEYCKKYLGIDVKTATDYVRIASKYKSLGLSEKDVIELGIEKIKLAFTKTGASTRFSKETIEKIKSIILPVCRI